MSAEQDERMEALLIGIDAGCLPIMEKLWDEGYLENLETVCRSGVVEPLESQIPPWTPSAWPSMYTGVNPGKHGVFGFVDYDGYDWHVVSGDDVREHSLWTLLDHHGMSSVVVNVPVTHPPDDIDGAVIPGFIGPEDPPCHPEGTLEEVREAIGEYRVYPAYARGDQDWSEEERMQEYEALTRMRGEAFDYLADEHEPDFGFLQFQRTDTVFHEFGGDWPKIRRVYEEMDEQVGKLLERHDPKRVFVASDHGMGPYDKEEFRVNEFLREEGYVTAMQGGKGMPSWNPIRTQLREGNDDDTWEPGFTEKLAASLARIGITTDRIGSGLDKLGLQDVARRYAPDGVVRTASTQVNFPDSVAYMRARTELGVRINLQGRDPEGVVPQSDYESVRDELIEALRDVEAPDGEPVFGEVGPREKYFSGPFTDKAVDIVTVPNDFQHFLSAQLLGGQFAEPTEPWNHKLPGIFAAAGEGIDPDSMVDDAHLFDVAPTILAALDLPVSDHMDGRVLPHVEETEEWNYPPYDATDYTVTAEDEEVQDRLADLGYLE
jgi:predicted AlkP superfamily phosphohydrolase/phosphomutase